MFPTVPFILPHGARFRLESTRLASHVYVEKREHLSSSLLQRGELFMR